MDNLTEYRLANAKEKLESVKFDFFIASRQDAEEQYQKAEELYEEVKVFLEK